MCRNDEIVPEIIEICKNNSITISTAESFTAGLIASTIASYPGASDILFGGSIAYTINAKNLFLNIPKKLIEKYGVVSKKIVQEMSINIRNITNTTIGISSTGYAGPGYDAGHIFICISFKSKIYTLELNLKKDRNQVRITAVNAVLNKLLQIIREV